MAFNPDEYLSGKSGGFDPDAYLNAKPAPSEGSGAAQTALEQYGNTALLGNLPQVQAFYEQFMPDASGGLDAKLKAQGFQIDQPNRYVDARDANIKRMARDAALNPKAALAGQLAGVVGGGLITGAAMPAVQGANLVGRLGQAAKAGAVMGGLSNPGDVEGVVSPFQIGDRLQNAAIGGVTGAATQGAVESLSALGRGASNYLKGAAEKRAFKALGPYQREARQAYEKDAINKIGRDLLNEGVVTGKPTSYEGLAERAGAVKERAGEKIGSIIDELDSLETKIAKGAGASDQALALPGSKSQQAKVGLDRKAMGQSLREDLISTSEIPGASEQNGFFSALIDEFENGGTLGLKKAQALKVELGKKDSKLIKWDRLPGADIPPREMFYRSLYRKLNTGVDDAADALASLAGGPTKEALGKAKSSYGSAATAEKIAGSREAKEFANRLISPSDYLTGGIGAGAGFASGSDMESKIKNAAIGASLGLGNKFLRQKGNQIAAVGSDAMSRLSARNAARLAALGAKPGALQGATAAIAQGVSGRNKLQANPDAEILNNPDLLKMLGEDPTLLDKIFVDEKTKKALQSKLNRKPADKQKQRRMKALEE